MYTRARLLTAAAFAALIMMALGSSSFGQGCTLIPGIFSGGGTIPNADSTNGKSTFTFSGDSCTADTPNLNINYNGRDGVSLQSTGVIYELCQCVSGDSFDELCFFCTSIDFLTPGRGPVYAADFQYRSKSKDSKGVTGEAIVCLQDNGEGAKAINDDLAAIFVVSGPFENYVKGGQVSGNVQSLPCD